MIANRKSHIHKKCWAEDGPVHPFSFGARLIDEVTLNVVLADEVRDWGWVLETLFIAAAFDTCINEHLDVIGKCGVDKGLSLCFFRFH